MVRRHPVLEQTPVRRAPGEQSLVAPCRHDVSLVETTIRSACWMVARWCAMMRTVRSFMRFWRRTMDDALGLAVELDVASSRIRMGAFLSNARAIAMRWRSRLTA